MTKLPGLGSAASLPQARGTFCGCVFVSDRGAAFLQASALVLPWVKCGPWLLPAFTLTRQMSDKHVRRAMRRPDREAGALCLAGDWGGPPRRSDLSGGT